jgi:hypothetical protein
MARRTQPDPLAFPPDTTFMLDTPALAIFPTCRAALAATDAIAGGAAIRIAHPIVRGVTVWGDDHAAEECTRMWREYDGVIAEVLAIYGQTIRDEAIAAHAHACQ